MQPQPHRTLVDQLGFGEVGEQQLRLVLLLLDELDQRQVALLVGHL